MEIGQIFHNKYIFNGKKTFQVEILLYYQHTTWKLTLMKIDNNPLICKASPEENGTGQYPLWITQKPMKGDFRVIKSKKFPAGTYPGPPKKLAPLALV